MRSWERLFETVPICSELSVALSFPAICKALHRIGAALAEANGLLTTLTTLKLIFWLCFWNTVSNLVFRLSNYLQGSRIDYITAKHLIYACCLELSELRDEQEFSYIERYANQKAGAETNSHVIND